MKKYLRQVYTSLITAIISYSIVIDVTAAPLDSNNFGRNKKSPCPQTFSIHDTDGNKSLSRDEYRKLVTEIEYQRATTGHLMQHYPSLLRFEEVDTNKDGYIVEDEMISALNRRLRKQRRYRYQYK